MIVEIAPEFGFVIAVLLALYLQQNVVFVVLFVRKARVSTKITAPILYPRDSDVKRLKLSDAEVETYLRMQRIHQNNLEFMSLFLPMFLVAGVYNPLHTALAGVWVLVFRMLFAFGYAKSNASRLIGAPFHVGELYVMYLAGRFAFELAKDSLIMKQS